MKQFVVFLLAISLTSVSCLKSDPDKRTFEYFNNHLKANMKFEEIKDVFGEPDEDKGSGIHIYVYKLKDGTSIWIGYTDKILYARHRDLNQQVIHRIL